MSRGHQEPEFAALLGESAGRALREWLALTGRTARPTGWLTGGRTNAQVAAIVMEGPGEKARKLLVKVCPAATGEPREPGRHREALRRSPRAFAERHLVRLPHDPVPVGGGGWLMFQDIADGSLARLRPLTELLDIEPASIAPASATILRSVLQGWNPASRLPTMPIADYLKLQLGRRLSPEGSLARWAAPEAALLADPAQWLLIPGEARPVPNPFALALYGAIGADLTVEALLGNAHGDLNLENILVPYESTLDAAAFRLIDLSRYSPDAPLARDPQHLLLSIVERFLLERSGQLRDDLLDFLADANPVSEARLPVWLRDTVIAIRQTPKSWVSRSGLVDEWVVQSWLCLMACALMFVGRATIPRDDRAWFFRLAARAGAAYLDAVGRYEPFDPRPVVLPGGPDQPRSAMAHPVAGEARPRGTPATAPEPLLESEERNRLHGLVSGIRSGTAAKIYSEAVAPLGPRLAGNPNDLVTVVRQLEDSTIAPGGLHPLIRFIELLAIETREPTASALRSWVDEFALRLGVAQDDLAKLRSAMPAARSAAQRKTYVVVQLQEDGVDRERYLMSVWLQHGPRGSWEALHLDDQPHALHELPGLLDELMSKIPDLTSGAVGGFVVEFILPRRLLSLDVDQWRVAVKTGLPRRLGIDQPVVVRSLDRIRDPRLHHEWRRKWGWLERNGQTTEIGAVRWLQHQGQADLDLEALMAGLLLDETPVCLVLLFTPRSERDSGQDELLAGLHAGLPIMLWCRDGRDQRRREAELRALLDRQGLHQLPELTLRLRREAVGLRASDDHVGRHLTLLWDDPNRIPESSNKLKAPA